jgi:hypothetical protein
VGFGGPGCLTNSQLAARVWTLYQRQGIDSLSDRVNPVDFYCFFLRICCWSAPTSPDSRREKGGPVRPPLSLTSGRVI